MHHHKVKPADPVSYPGLASDELSFVMLQSSGSLAHFRSEILV
jgi:hypothetical protein